MLVLLSRVLGALKKVRTVVSLLITLLTSTLMNLQVALNSRL